jgi:hypothetical protein
MKNPSGELEKKFVDHAAGFQNDYVCHFFVDDPDSIKLSPDLEAKASVDDNDDIECDDKDIGLADCETDGDVRDKCKSECDEIRSKASEEEFEDLILHGSIVNENYCGSVKEECRTDEEWTKCTKTCAGYFFAARKSAPLKNREDLKTEKFDDAKAEYEKNLNEFRKIYRSRESEDSKKKQADELENQIIEKFRSTIQNLPDTLQNHPWAKACLKLEETGGEECLQGKKYRFKELLNNIKQDCKGDTECEAENKKNADELKGAFVGKINRRRLVELTQNQTDDASGVLGDFVSGANIFNELGYDGIGNLGALVSVAIPLTRALNGDAEPEARVRALIEAQFNIVSQVTANVPGLGPISDLFALGNALSIGVNGSEACGSGKCSPELIQEMPKIVVTAVLETFGNGHLLDLFHYFR